MGVMVIVEISREDLETRREKAEGVVAEIEDSCCGMVDVKESERS